MLEGGVIVEVVLPGVETEVAAGGGVFRQVVDVEGLRGIEAVVARWRGDRFPDAGLMKPVRRTCTASSKSGNSGNSSKIHGHVDGVDVGKENEAVAGGGELADALPHRLVGSEDVLPGVVEFLGRGVGFHHFERPAWCSHPTSIRPVSNSSLRSSRR